MELIQFFLHLPNSATVARKQLQTKSKQNNLPHLQESSFAKTGRVRLAGFPPSAPEPCCSDPAGSPEPAALATAGSLVEAKVLPDH